jgi:hypothetical protein
VTTVEVHTVTAGEQYRVTFRGERLTFRLDRDECMVAIYSATQNHGGWRLDRFAGVLSPESIRAFLATVP